MLIATRIRSVVPTVRLVLKRWTSSSSVLDPAVLEAARQNLKAKIRPLRTLKIEAPNRESDRQLLIDLEKDAPGLWNVHEITAQSGILNKRVYFMFDSHENAARTLARIKEMGCHVQQSWKAQFHHDPTSISFGEPSPTLAIRLGIRGTLEDVKRLFRDYHDDAGSECIPLDAFLFDGRNMCCVHFRTTEHAEAARSWLINKEKTLCHGYPPFTVADIGFSASSVGDVAAARRDILPSRWVHVSGLGCRIDKATLAKLLRSFGGIESISLPRSWRGASFGRAVVEFKTIRDAERAKRTLDGTYFPGSGRYLTMKYEAKTKISDSVGRVPSTLRVQPPMDGSASYLRHLVRIIRQAPGLYHVWDDISTNGQSTAYLEFDNSDNAQRALLALGRSYETRSPENCPPSKIIHKPRYSANLRMNYLPSPALRASLGARESLKHVIQAYRGLKPLKVWLYEGEDAAFIVFASVEDARAAFAARNGQPLQEGGPVSFVSFAFHRSDVDRIKFSRGKTKQLHISGLGCRTTKEELYAFCQHTEGFVGSTIKCHWTGRSMGYGYLAFRSIADAEAGLRKLQGTVYPHSGREVDIVYAFDHLSENIYDGIYPD